MPVERFVDPDRALTFARADHDVVAGDRRLSELVEVVEGRREVGVGEGNQVAGCSGHAGAQRGGLAAVGNRSDADAGVVRGEDLGDGAGLIGAAVVDEQEFRLVRLLA